MNILITSQRYWPENFRITDIAEELVNMGHDVTVLTGLPNYPRGYIFDEYKNGKNRNEIHNGVQIIRAKEFARRNNILSRFLNYYSFPFFAKRIIRKMKTKYDVVLINNSSPILSSRVGAYYKKVFGVKAVMYEMDLWPESLLAGGIKKDGLIYKHFTKVSRDIYCQMDKILVTTKEHIGYIKSIKGCEHLDVDYLHQYAETMFEQMPLVCEKKNKFNLTFAGNIGLAQNVEVILRAAILIKERKDITIHIVGEGREYASLLELKRKNNIDNVIFHGAHPLSEMPDFYNMSDAMIVTLEDSSYANMTIPGKIQSYMACGKPIIASINGATASLINESESGIVCPANDAVSLARTMIAFCDDPNKEKYSINAANYYRQHFMKKDFMKRLVDELKKKAGNL